MATNYNKQVEARLAVWEALVDLQRRIDYSYRQAEAQRGDGPFLHGSSTLTVDDEGQVIQNEEFWMITMQNLRSSRDSWIKAYALMLYGGQPYDRDAILDKIRAQAARDPMTVASDAVS